MRTPTTRLLGAALTLSMLGAACAGSDDSAGDADSPGATLGTVPDPEATTETAGPTDATVPLSTPVASGPAATKPDTTEVTATDPAADGASSTTVLAPSPQADLPTQAPQTGTVPVTTISGPLPEPSAQLVDVATFAQPVEATSVPGDSRLFVVENGGTIVAVDDLSNETVFDIATVESATFTNAGNEQGLLGLAFHPELDLAYVDFTDGDGNTVVAEFAHDPVTFQFDPATYRPVLTIDQPEPNHNGGELAFGPDEMLYIGTGDGGGANDPDGNGLDTSSRLGKILRIDPVESDTEPFTVPDDNPFVDDEGADPTIWSLGLRNPWRFSFDSLTGDLWIGDVGQNRLEEIDLAPATDGLDAGRGISFGWSAFEAEDRFNEDQSADGHTLPVVSYVHEDENCSVSGGVVARDSTYRNLNGWYVYGDYCSGRVWALDTTSVTSTPDGPVGEPTIVEIATVPNLTAVVDGPLGDIYALSLDGPIYRLAPE